MGGSFISLLMSKMTAKRFSGARVIEQPANELESWYLNTVRRQAKAAGIGIRFGATALRSFTKSSRDSRFR